MKRFIPALLLLLIAFSMPVLAFQENTGVTAEALGQANLRSTTDVNSDLVGAIESGTRYPVIGRSEFYPWLLLADPATIQPLGWVFNELVTTQGNLNNVPFSTQIVSDNPPTSTLSSTAVAQAGASITATPTHQLVGVAVPVEPSATPTQDFSNVINGLVNGEVNIRFGPGVDYPRIGVAYPGERYQISAWHTQLPWLQIVYPDSPNGFGWIAQDLLDIEGDVFSLPSISQTNLNLPTLTPTPAVVVASAQDGRPTVPLSPEFAELGNQVWDIVLKAGFDPATSRFGALFVMDLQTGEAFSFGSEYAFSGTSINKVAILARLYETLTNPPDTRTAIDIANTMICSENVATNRLLSIIGNGDEYLGANETTKLFEDLGLEKSFITAPYSIPNQTPQPPSSPILLPTTAADQTKANPDLTNELAVDDMGWLLADIYQCAYNQSGPLIENFDGQYDARECRQMLHVMSNNTVDALLKAGVPADTRVAHKHGWINDTHGNAAVFFTPGGNYVVVMMLHQPDWLNFQESLPVIAEVSRAIYNYYNPDEPMTEVREGYIPEAPTCNFAGTPLIDDIMNPIFNQ
ncbi:MAG: serine hydrolase [Anaerolineae bacterium]|nr:serine hydrolase [Anaerolineae bacterium]